MPRIYIQEGTSQNQCIHKLEAVFSLMTLRYLNSHLEFAVLLKKLFFKKNFNPKTKVKVSTSLYSSRVCQGLLAHQVMARSPLTMHGRVSPNLQTC